MAVLQPTSISGTALAGFWVRAVAYIVDGLVVGTVSALLSSIQVGFRAPSDQVSTVGGVGTLIWFLYLTLFWSAGGGQTLGQRLLGLRVVRTDGGPLSFGTAAVRWIGLWVSFLVLCIGVIWVAFDAQKQGWHDKIAGTYVVHVPRA